MMFPEIKKNFGFGCMRLPTKDDRIDTAEFSKMIDFFLANGFNYFDTAHGYHSGNSELAVRECLTSRYPREAYLLTDKLTGPYFETQADIRPFFQSQLEACGVDYFDFYLMHAQDAVVYEKFKACRAYETAFELKAEGKIRHVGLSFHDKAVVLERILTEYPQIEVVQIQFNYVDYDDAAVEAAAVYEVCRKFGKPIIVMEPVKGGTLVQLPPAAAAVLDSLKGGSHASYAIRYAAGFEGVCMTLSGMGNMAMMEDNISFMKDFIPLTAQEHTAVETVRELFRKEDRIACTACRYCVDGCPASIPIPDLFACLNAANAYKTWNSEYYYDIHTQNGGKASACIECGACEAACPQHLPIRDLLKTVAAEFEK